MRTTDVKRIVDLKGLGYSKDGLIRAIDEVYDEARWSGGLAPKRQEEGERFYQEVFGLTQDLSGVAIPSEQPGFGCWVLMVAQGLTLNQVWAKCKEQFPSHSYLGEKLDKIVKKNDRTAKQAYAKRFRDRVEADEELKDISANQLKKLHIQSITLLERLLLELWYFWKTGQHLDIRNITLCAGSRCSDGFVPNVCWSRDRLKVEGYYPNSSRYDLRTRAAV